MNGDRAITGHVNVPAGVRVLVDDDDARALAGHLLAEGRRWPVVVATAAPGFDTPHIDAAAIAADLRGLAEVISITSQSATWALADLLPPNSQVYGGATRVYPVDPEWQVLTRRARMTLTYSPADSARSVDRVVSDALSAALAAGLLDQSTSARSVTVTGTVTGLMPERALISLPDGGFATLREELTGFGVPIAQVVRVGQQVRGRRDEQSGRFDLEAPAAAALPPDYSVGATVLARLAAVRTDGLVAELAPGLAVDVPREAVTGNGLDDIDALFSADEVVAVQVTSLDPVAVSFLEVGDDLPPVSAPSILDGGPPWLIEPPAWTEPELRGPTAPAVPEPVVPPPAAPDPLPAPGPQPAPIPGPRPGPPSGSGARPSPSPHIVHAASTAAPPAPAPTASESGAALRSAQLSLAAARAENDRLNGAAKELVHVRNERDALVVENHRLTRRVDEFRERYRSADRTRQSLERKARASATTTASLDSRQHFTNVEDALRHDVRETWVRTIPAGEKAASPLPEWEIGTAFTASLTHLDPVPWDKLCAVVLDVLLQSAERLSMREDHPLAVGTGSGPAVTRADGSVARRIYLQQNFASARRLHYWRRGSAIELSRVVLHDDYLP